MKIRHISSHEMTIYNGNMAKSYTILPYNYSQQSSFNQMVKYNNARIKWYNRACITPNRKKA